MNCSDKLINQIISYKCTFECLEKYITHLTLVIFNSLQNITWSLFEIPAATAISLFQCDMFIILIVLFMYTIFKTQATKFEMESHFLIYEHDCNSIFQ